jgi:hypothetical protein
MTNNLNGATIYTVFIRENRASGSTDYAMTYGANEMAEIFTADELDDLLSGQVLTRLDGQRLAGKGARALAIKERARTCQYVLGNAVAANAFAAA